MNAGLLLPPHAVQFYEDEASLLDSIDDFVRDGLEVGDAVLVLARPAHLVQLELRLSGTAEVHAARATHQYVTLDASEVLAQILQDGRLDEGRFGHVVGGLIAKAKADFPGVRAFGEMVAILWEQGRADAAVELEVLWNGVVKRDGIVLRCAYPLRLFDRAMHVGPFSEICDQHAHVQPAEGYPGPGNPDQRLRVVAELQQKARALEGEVLVRRRAEEALAKHATHLEAMRAELQRIREELQDFVESVPEKVAGVDRVIASARRVQTLVSGLLTEVRIGTSGKR
jgi:hypothetical protein